jgi:predicted Rossmann-fold nucleotide-binding protein
MDEFFEALTLIQTHKMINFPIVLMGRDYWKGLTQWLKRTAVREGTIAPQDVDLFQETDDPVEATRIISDNYRARQHLDTGATANGEGKVLDLKSHRS